jgi:hypothetical protein
MQQQQMRRRGDLSLFIIFCCIVPSSSCSSFFLLHLQCVYVVHHRAVSTAEQEMIVREREEKKERKEEEPVRKLGYTTQLNRRPHPPFSFELAQNKLLHPASSLLQTRKSRSSLTNSPTDRENNTCVAEKPLLMNNKRPDCITISRRNLFKIKTTTATTSLFFIVFFSLCV